LAFRVRAFAAALLALVAISRRFSAVMVVILALPPRRPNLARYCEKGDLAM
jgi:hypothetical protein